MKRNHQTEDKQTFDLNVKTNFPEIFQLYVAIQNRIPCYFCDFISKKQTLKNIKNEITRHIETDHEEIIEDFNNDNMEVENAIHLEFVEFCITE